MPGTRSSAETLKRPRLLAWPTVLVLLLCLPTAPALGEVPTTLLHSFSFSDGSDPHGSLITVGDYLYGMTKYGGADQGVIFKMNKSGGEYSVLHNFTSGSGMNPEGAMVEVGGKLYGLTTFGAYSTATGVLFNIGLDGTGYHVLHTFLGLTENDGAEPHGTPVHVDGVLYGFTLGGGTPSGGVAGTVFKYVIADSTYTVLHYFDRYTVGAGYGPFGSPVVIGDVLYGTTISGDNSPAANYGTIFRIGRDGSGYQVLHHCDVNDADNAAYINADLTRFGDDLFGMSRLGGSDAGPGMGTIFKMDTTGTNFEILHRFLGPDYNPEGDDDGREPWGALTPHGDYLYGMTTNGGSLDRGTIFRVKPDGTEYEVLHSFLGGLTDGKRAWHARPVCEGGMLYAATRQGGSFSDYGAVVSMAIDPPVAIPEEPGNRAGPTLTVGSPYPNPGFSGAAVIVPFTLPAADAVALELYNAAGRLLARRPAVQFAVPGQYQIR
jgi:uncharacterized repeat protein (TIGR03803 family)